jgi:hypothetical protein
MKLEFSRQFLWNPHTKFHENPAGGRRVVPCGQTDMTKLTVAFRNFCENRLNYEQWMKILAVRLSSAKCGHISSMTFRQDFRLQATARQIRTYEVYFLIG